MKREQYLILGIMLIVIVLVSGCIEKSSVEILTDKNAYTQGEEIEIRIQNHLKKPIYYIIDCCESRPFYIRNSTHGFFIDRICACEGFSINKIEPDETIMVGAWNQNFYIYNETDYETVMKLADSDIYTIKFCYWNEHPGSTKQDEFCITKEITIQPLKEEFLEFLNNSEYDLEHPYSRCIIDKACDGKFVISILVNSSTDIEQVTEILVEYGNVTRTSYYESIEEYSVIFETNNIYKVNNFIDEPFIIGIFLDQIESDYELNLTDEELYGCNIDEDCVNVKSGCCGCGGGGSATTISKDVYDEWSSYYGQICKMNICLGVMSQHISCYSEPKCINNKCVLKINDDLLCNSGKIVNCENQEEQYLDEEMYDGTTCRELLDMCENYSLKSGLEYDAYSPAIEYNMSNLIERANEENYAIRKFVARGDPIQYEYINVEQGEYSIIDEAWTNSEKTLAISESKFDIIFTKSNCKFEVMCSSSFVTSNPSCSVVIKPIEDINYDLAKTIINQEVEMLTGSSLDIEIEMY